MTVGTRSRAALVDAQPLRVAAVAGFGAGFVDVGAAIVGRRRAGQHWNAVRVAAGFAAKAVAALGGGLAAFALLFAGNKRCIIQ